MIDTMPRPAGAAPDSGYKALTVRIQTELHDELRAVATQKERSLNFVAARVIRAGLDELRKSGWIDAKD